MAELHVSITGDCTGLSNAIDSSHAKIDSLDGRQAGVIVGLQGASATVTGLTQVATAAGRVPNQIDLGVNSSGLAEAAANFGGLRDQARGLGRDMDALAGSRTFGVTNDGSFLQLAGDLGQVSSGYANFGSSADSGLRRADSSTQGFTRSVSGLNDELSQADRVGTSFNSTLGDVDRSASGALQPVQQLAQSSVMLAEGGAAAADVGRDLESSLGRVGRAASLTGGQVSNVNRILDEGRTVAGFDSFNASNRLNSAGPPPVEDPPFGRGGGGGGGEDKGPFGDNDLLKKGGGLDSGISKLGMPAVVLGAVGLVEALGAAAGGFLAVNAVVADTPALAYASGKAMAQLGDGIRQGAAGAAAIGVPAFQALGQALRPLGEEIGQVGKANIGNIIGAETTLAGGATEALRNLAPAIGPSIKAAESLGDAFLKGISSPAVAQSITALSNALSTPQMSQAVQQLTTWAATAAPYVAQGVTAVTSILGGGNGATNVGSGWLTQPVGETVAEHSAGLLSYDPTTDRGQAASAPLPGGDAGVGWNQQTTLGRGMTAVGSTLHTAGLAARDFMNGSMLRGTAADELHAAGDDQSARWSAFTSGTPQGYSGVPASDQTLASSQAAAPWGYDQGPGGSLTPSLGPGGGGASYPGGPAVPPMAPLPNFVSPPPPPPTPGAGPSPLGGQLRDGSLMGGIGGGTSVGAIPSRDIQQLNQALTQTTPAASSASQSLSQLPSRFSGAASSASQLQTSATSLATPLQTVQQHAAAANTAATQLTQSAPAAVASAAQITPAVQRSMDEAQSAVQSGGNAIGQSLPTTMGDGITQNQSAACTAAQKLGDGTKNCAAASLQSASPSKVFMDLGVGVSQGLAIGIETATPQAVAAVQSSMAQVVAAGQAGLAAASPSKTFQDYGAQAVNNVTTGATNAVTGGYAQQQQAAADEEQKRQQELARETAANLPQNALSKAAEDEKKKQDDDAKKVFGPEAQRDEDLKKLGYSETTRKRVEDDEKRRADIKKQADTRRQDDQALAMNRVGIPIQPMGPDQPLTPFEQFKKRQQDTHDRDQQRAQDDLRKSGFFGGPPGGGPPGETPGQKFVDKEKVQHDRDQQRAKGDLRDMQPGMHAIPTDGGPGGAPGPYGGKDGGGDPGKGLGGGLGDAGDGGGGDFGDKVVNGFKNKTKTHSPSQVFYDLGTDLTAGLSLGLQAGAGAVTASAGDVMSGALGSGVTAASNSVLGIASNAGLAVGYQWARNVVTGADSVLKTADFQQVSLPQLGSALATTALGTAGLLPPSGSGGSIPNNQTITMAGGTAALPTQAAPIVNVYNSIDGTQLRGLTRTEIINAFGQLADSVPQQVG